MHITFAPMRRDDQLTLSVAGACLTLNGVGLDFSDIPEGGRRRQAETGCDWLASDVERRDGVLYVTVILPHGARAPQQTLFPTPVTVTQDGMVTLPPYALPEPEADPAFDPGA